MRLLAPSFALTAAFAFPAVALASPFAVPLTANDLNVWEPPADTSAPSVGEGEDAPAEDASAEDAPAEDAPAEDAPAEDAPAEDAPAEDDAAEGEGDEVPTGDEEAIEADEDEGDDDEDDEDLEDELAGPKKKGDFNANAIGVHGGIHLIPSYFLNAALASYGNALCRNEVGGWGEKNGLVKVDGCNFYVGGDYTRRISRAFDIRVGLGYLHVQAPDSLWIDNGEWDRDSCTEDTGGGPESNCNLGAADYTEIDLRMFTIDINFIGRGTLYRNSDVEIQLGGGGGVGAGILLGEGVRRTPLGVSPSGYTEAGGRTPDSCQTLEDTADFRKCTPRFYVEGDGDARNALDPDDDPDNFPNGTGTSLGVGPGGDISTGTSFARCTEHKCDGGDLAAFDASETGGTWPAYPIINIFGSFRVIIKDSFGITIEGGIKDGFFFGGGMQYYFGGGGKDK